MPTRPSMPCSSGPVSTHAMPRSPHAWLTARSLPAALWMRLSPAWLTLARPWNPALQTLSR